MKKYAQKANLWMTAKVLEFLSNFLKNHATVIKDSDIFDPITNLLDNCDYEKKIKEFFPEKTIAKMTQNNYNSLDFFDEPSNILHNIWNFSFARKRLVKMLLADIKLLQKKLSLTQYINTPIPKDITELFPKRLLELQNTFDLTNFEVNVMLVMAFLDMNKLKIDDFRYNNFGPMDKADFIAKCLDCDVSEIINVLDCNKKLRRYGCLEDDFDFNRNLFSFLNGVSDEPLNHKFFKLCKETTLPWSFYGDLATKHGVLIKDILKNENSCSSNILLYGAPGTGKTSFAKTLAEQLGKKCYLISQDTQQYSSSSGSTSSPNFRFAALQICDAQIDNNNSIIIIDEADEMLQGNKGMSFFFDSNSSKGDKCLLNDILDNIKTPTIWIANIPAEALDESSRRRFDYSICFEQLNAIQRKSIWQNNINKMELNALIDDQMAEEFSCRYHVNAGIITKVLSNVKKLATTPKEVKTLTEKLMAQHCQLLNINISDSKLLPTKDYSINGLNIKGDISLDKIVTAVQSFQSQSASNCPDTPRMNLLLSGPPGTGKTEFVKYLGNILNTKVSLKMGSDLLSMYVGGTEQNIKAAFAQAEAEHAILFLDEIDGLVQSRNFATRNFEITQVNELLHQMENFNGIMVGATNFVQNLDPAIMRRFTFKLGFDYLDNNGKVVFFERMFNTKLSSVERYRLENIPKLTPGDFRTVRQSLYYLNEVSNNARLAALEEESKIKTTSLIQGNNSNQKIGF